MKRLRGKSTKTQFLIGLGGLILTGFLFIINTIISLPKPEELSNLQVSQSTKLYDRTGKVLLYEIYGEKRRTVIPAEEIPEFARRATISIEDESFYEHPAFDWQGILRALTVNLIRGQVVQGGSTITQQLAKNAFLTSEKTLTRKIKELVLAMQLEQRYGKEEILSLYLNHIPYGAGYYGIEAASQAYFNKPAKDLTLAEAALLAALPRSPSYYSPWGSHLDELMERKNFILKRMAELGYIDDEQLQSALVEVIKITPQPESSIKAAHFAIYVQDYLTQKYGEEALRSGGLKVTTTLDWELQQLAEEVVKNGAERNERLYGGSNAALLAIDPQTGQILAMVGSRNYFDPPEPEGCTQGRTCRFEGNFNVATQGLRQPGSAFKPFAYLNAFQKGLTPETVVWDTPTEFSPSCPAAVDLSNRDRSCYHPRNFDLRFRGPVRLKEALAQSINVPSVKVLYLAGLNDTIELASRFGVTTLNDPERLGLSLVLGGGEIKLIELLGAYSVLANEGVYRSPTTILKIEDDKGKVLEEYKERGEEVVDPQYPRLVNDILSDTSLRAPLFIANLELTQVPGYQVALKTGTTDDYVDAWAFGYTPNLAVGVWAGNNNRAPLKSQGGSILAAVPIWHDFISKAIPKRSYATFNRPAQVFAEHPVLRGELIAGESHDILYYLNRMDDPQASHWEAGVHLWLQSNSVDLGRFRAASTGGDYQPGIGRSGGGQLTLELLAPSNGSFISNPFNLQFEVRSANQINKIEIYLNDRLIDSRVGELGEEFSYRKNLMPAKLSPQNLLVVRVTNEAGIRAEEELILFVP